MWRPPERIKHPLPEAKWPKSEEAASSLLFSPIRIGPMTLRERTWVPAMVPWRCTEEGFVTQDILDWYARFAEGRPGAIVVEATGIREIPSGPLMRIGHDRFIPGLKQLVDTVREASQGETRLLIQLIDFLTVRRRPTKEKYFGKYFRPDETHDRESLIAKDDVELRGLMTEREWEAYKFGYRDRITDPHVSDLPRTLPGLFADAAARAEQAGFDGVELHYAHAYTMASFLSARNTRDDGYGGSRENRVRLPLEVYEAVRSRVSDKTAVGCRYLSRDCIPGGNESEDSVYFGVRFSGAGMDFLSVSRGGKFEDAKEPAVGWAVYPYTGPSGYECMPTVQSDKKGPFGRNVADTAAIRRAVKGTPVVVAGGICTFEQAEGILKRGEADVVASARQTLADPDWFRKMRLGRGEEVRRCVYTNYCEGLDQKHKKVTCKLWDRVDRSGHRRLTAPPWEE